MENGVGRGQSSAFSVYLRTGRRVAAGPLEVKFNPWHDAENGQFTFSGQGQYFGAGGSSSGNPGAVQRRNIGRPMRPDADGVPDRSHLDADHPGNYSIFIVERGDTLSHIAARRKGLTARDLAWLNKHPIDQPLTIGQRIKVPTQVYLDAGRAARAKFLGLAYYMDTHGGKLPPDPTNPLSMESQIFDANWRRESKNGYDFYIDIALRTRKAFGRLSLASVAIRSRRNQSEAGKPDRRAGDDGGHFIAARFNGPSASFNHFAQDASFNRGAYRAMEDSWAKALRAGRKVFVTIEPHYAGTSRRPDNVRVTWIVDGEKRIKNFPNEPKGHDGGER